MSGKDRVRVRQHVNPFSPQYQTKIAPPDWADLFEDTSKPIHLDLGCARGSLILKLAQQFPQNNYIGLEIRKPLVESCNCTRDEYQLKNLHYMFCNVSVSVDTILESLPKDKLESVSILYPDPCFKKKHHKRRMLQPETVTLLAKHLKSGAKVYLASDVLEVAEYLRDSFKENDSFNMLSNDWVEEFLPVQSEREIATLKKNLPVYRIIFQKV